MRRETADEDVTQAAFARMHNVSRKTVSIWKQRDWLCLTDDGKVLIEASNARLEQRPKRYRGGTARGLSAATEQHDLRPVSDAVLCAAIVVATDAFRIVRISDFDDEQLSEVALAAMYWAYVQAAKIKTRGVN